MVCHLRESTALEEVDTYMNGEMSEMRRVRHSILVLRRHGIPHHWRFSLHPPCDCKYCAEQFLSMKSQSVSSIYGYTTVLTDVEAAEVAIGLTEKLHHNLKYLRDQCAKYGGVISRRWRKKSHEKRKDLLLDVDPNLYPKWCEINFIKDYLPFHNQPHTDDDFTGDINASPGWAMRPYRNTWLLPYMNLEALIGDPALFLSILFGRVNYTPQQWFPHDLSLLDRSWRLGAFEVSYNAKNIITEGPFYGMLVARGEQGHAWDVSFPKGILALEAQTVLSEILEGMVRRLVHGIDAGNAPDQSDMFRRPVELGLQNPTSKSHALDFASTYLSLPHSAPPVFDVKSLTSFVQAELNCHTDHLWLLQTDPLYLRRYIALNLAGDIGEHLTKNNQSIQTVTRLQEDAMVCYTWNLILDEAKKIEEMYRRYKHQIILGLPLPLVYERSLGSFMALLEDIIVRQAQRIHGVLPGRPGLRRNWATQYLQVPSGLLVMPRRAKTMASIKTFSEDRLDFCLTKLVQNSICRDDKVNKGRFEHSMFLNILDEHLSISPKAEIARLDEILYNSFSNLSALEQILTMVRLHQPRVAIRKLEEAKHTEKGKVWRYVRNSFFDQVSHEVQIRQGPLGPGVTTPVSSKKNHSATELENAALAGKLLRDFLGTPRPSGSRLSQKWLDQDNAQRQACSRLWQQIRSSHRDALLVINTEHEDIESDLKLLSADSDPSHILSVQTSYNEILDKIAAKCVPKSAVVPGSVIPSQLGLVSKFQNPELEPKLKIKTRSAKAPSEHLESSVDNLPISDDANEPEIITVAVPKRPLGILQSLFPSRNFEERTKSVDWPAFVNAMAEAGFDAKQIHGSQYSFEPNETSKWFGRGRIVFHRPHPEPKYEVWKLLGIGKRMSKWFDWNVDTFVLKK